MSELRPALIVFALLTVLTGIAYPLVVTGIGQAAFHSRANGSIIESGGRAVGSQLLGQPFSGPKYFWSRPSATGPAPYNGAASSGSNQGPINPALETAVKERIAALRAADPGNTMPVPVDLVARYGGPLEIPITADRPTLLVNFVATLDGVVALGPGEERGGGVISGFFEPDRFVMALLRAIADVVLMGAGTIAGTSSTNWTAEHLQPDHAAAFARWRHDLGLAAHPTTVIVTGSGDVPLGRRGVDDPTLPVIFATTAAGAAIATVIDARSGSGRRAELPCQ